MDTPTKIGRYEILAELGRGAMGIVYRAKDPVMDRVVALKTIISVALQGPQGAEFRERFYREARTAGAMSHPGIVRVFDVGEHEGAPYLVMEFIVGRTLDVAIKKGERRNLDRICELGAQIAAALGYAHQRGVVHRDIKPANILLTSQEAYGIERSKITDFGVAKLAEGQTTLTGQMLGTPAFMPPEQFTGSPIDGRSDLFSLGVVLYSMATGEQPFPGESISTVSYKVVQSDPVPPRKINPAIPPGLDRVILKCLEKSPAERYQTGEELAHELSELRAAFQATARPISSTQVPGRIDPEATLGQPVSVGSGKLAAASQLPNSSIASAGKRDRRLALVAAIVAVVAAAGWYVFRSSGPAVFQQIPPSVATTTPAPAPADAYPTAPSTPTPPPTSRASGARAAADVGVGGKKADANTSSASVKADVPPKAAKALPMPAALDFNPEALDRKQNARLEIDAERMPKDLEFIVEMNGKLYLRKSGPEAYKQESDLFVPPGVHEFRVRAMDGKVEKVSNTVSTEFKADKRNNLAIELRLQGMPMSAGMPQGLYPNSQLVLTLK